MLEGPETYPPSVAAKVVVVVAVALVRRDVLLDDWRVLD